MSDEKINEEAYSFPNDEDEEKYSMSPIGGTENILSLFKNKRLMMSLSGVIAFYVLVQGGVWLFVSKKSENTNKMTVQNTVPQKVDKSLPVVKPTQPIVDDAPSAPVAKLNTELNDVDHQKMQVLDQQLIEQKQRINRLTQKLESKEQSLQEVQAGLRRLEQQFRSIVGPLQQTVNRLSAIQAAKEAARKAKLARRHHKKVVKYTYYIRAAIHGRAWLVDAKGHRNLSVTIGDSVPSYGRVVDINVDNGTISTSTGRTIYFSAADR